MIKKSNKNYTNFDSYEFAEIRRYPYAEIFFGITLVGSFVTELL